MFVKFVKITAEREMGQREIKESRGIYLPAELYLSMPSCRFTA